MLVVVVFCLALVALLLLRSADGSSARPSEGAARAAVLGDPAARSHLARHPFDRVQTTPLDDHSTRVAFFDGPRIVLEAAVPRAGDVASLNRYAAGHVRIGSAVGQSALGLAGLVALFLLSSVRLPLRRIENVDAAALALFVVPIVLLNERLLEWSVIAAGALLVYLTGRCARVALGPVARDPGVAVFERMSRLARRLCVACAAAALALLSIPGGLVSDVGFASMAGATKLLAGALPYGELVPGDLVHGDTYPILAYLAYLPAALIAPVRDGFDNLDGALWVATGCSLLAASALGFAARRAGGDGSRVALGMLAFPPVMIAASSGSNDVVAAAVVAMALALGSTAALTAAGWVKLAPLALVPLWVAAARRRGRTVVGAAALSAGLAIALLALGGPAGLADMAAALSFQAERGSLLSPWTVLGIGAAQAVFQAAVLAGIAAACMRVRRDRGLASDPRRMAGLGAAILLAVQLAANYWSYTYLAWVFPLIALALLMPSRAPQPSA